MYCIVSRMLSGWVDVCCNLKRVPWPPELCKFGVYSKALQQGGKHTDIYKPSQMLSMSRMVDIIRVAGGCRDSDSISAHCTSSVAILGSYTRATCNFSFSDHGYYATHR